MLNLISCLTSVLWYSIILVSFYSSTLMVTANAYLCNHHICQGLLETTRYWNTHAGISCPHVLGLMNALYMHLNYMYLGTQSVQQQVFCVIDFRTCTVWVTISVVDVIRCCVHYHHPSLLNYHHQ